MKLRHWLGVFGVLVSGVAGAEEMLKIQRVADPPPAVDGSLSRLLRLTEIHRLDARQTVFGADKLSGEGDLAAEAIVGYDPNYLYLGVTVTDDTFRQQNSQSNLWKGDHIMLLVDYPVQENGKADLKKVFRIGISPGNFAEIKPEVFQWNPVLQALPEARAAAVRTASGYKIEAALPWSVFGIKQVEEGMTLKLDLLVSDTDGDNQESVLSLNGKPGRLLNSPDRFGLAVLTDGNLRVDPAKLRSGKVEKLGDTLRIAPQTASTVDIPDALAANARELRVRAYLDAGKYAGATNALKVAVNGTVLDGSRLRNRGDKIEFGTHIIASENAGHVFYLPYAGSFDPEKCPGFMSNGERIDPFDFRFDLTGLLKPSGNTVAITNARDKITQPMVAELALCDVLSPALAARKLADAPTGEIPAIQPLVKLTQPLYTASLTPGGAVAVKLNGQTYTVDSAYSTLTPGWAALAAARRPQEWRTFTVKGDTLSAATSDFRLERTIRMLPTHIQVVDKLTNLTDRDLPLMYRHEFAPGKYEAGYIGGQKTSGAAYAVESGEHPASLAITGDGGLGLLAEDDYTRAQGGNYLQDGKFGLRNMRFVLTPGREIATEFSLYPLEKGDHFLFINRVRDAWENNFTIDGSTGFMGAGALLARQTVDSFRTYSRNKSMNFVLFGGHTIGNTAMHGNAWNEVDLSSYTKAFALSRAARPELSVYIYFHCYISNGKNDVAEFADARVLTSNGLQADYGGGHYPIFMPVEGGKFAQVQEQLIEKRLNELGADAIYWDEIAYSSVKYNFNPDCWDGVSAIIDPATHRITRKVSCVTLATLPWRMKVTEKMIAMSKAKNSGRPALIGNGAPMTRSFNRFKFPRFIETGSITNLVLGQLYTPLALGDHLGEKDEVDSYKNMVRGLDYGAVYYWYRNTLEATHPTLTDAMFPITPIDLGAGYIVGKERILTNRSGYFGWDDGSKFTSRVFNRSGVEVKDYQIPAVVRDGKNFAEVRIPEGYSVALIRQ